MSTYVCILLNNVAVLQAFNIKAESLEVAIARATKLRPLYPNSTRLEVWQRQRMLYEAGSESDMPGRTIERTKHQR